jgi:hypothetical protein
MEGEIKAPPSAGAHMVVNVREYQPSPRSGCRLNCGILQGFQHLRRWHARREHAELPGHVRQLGALIPAIEREGADRKSSRCW